MTTRACSRGVAYVKRLRGPARAYADAYLRAWLGQEPVPPGAGVSIDRRAEIRERIRLLCPWTWNR